MPEWQFNVVPSPGGPEIPLQATSRSMQFKLGPGEYTQGSFTVDGRSATAQLMSELVSDVIVRCNGTPLARCSLTGGTATLDGTSHKWDASFVDYRGRLSRILLQDSDADLIRTITLDGDPVGGTWALSLGGHTTVPLSPLATAAQVQAALVALPNVGNHVTVTSTLSGTNGGPYTATFDTTVTDTKLVGINALGSGEQQVTVPGSPTGGTFRLGYAGQVSAPIAWNASAIDFETAVAALPTVGGLGNLTVSSPALGWYTVTFSTPKAAGTLYLAENKLTGGTWPTVKVAAQPTAVNIAAGSTTSVTFSHVDAGDIPRQLIASSAQYVGGNLGIKPAQTPGPTVGASTTQSFEVGQSVMTAIDQAAQQNPGFEWDIDPNKVLQIYPNDRGYDRTSQTWAFGGEFVSVTRAFDPTQYGNWIRVTGGSAPAASEAGPSTPLAPVAIGVADLATRPEGLWASTASDQDITSATVLNQYALWELDIASSLPVTYTCLLKPGLWQGPQTLWLGDTITLVVRDGRLDINTPVRCVEIDITLGDDGSEQVTAIFGRRRVPFHKRLGRLAAAVGVLERHT